ncbi:hypothetical protein O7634_15150 [Micromonospora sp. WMMD1120]|uniref:hypothetical protein n=1 Tax=Micromonospora sp. WMMD1120 TaxID=3016106 RepID=UPI002416BA5B|nr:hypothetical protein [Micromonospora sp. WMMD1120]MDG4808091.1 hypothetical protein [Micromonospora sp. WMMD1120]
MGPEIVIAMVSGAVALISMVVTYRTTLVTHRLQDEARSREKVEAAEDLFRRYRVPLLSSAESLQSRLHNVLGRGFLRGHLHSANSEDQHYVRHNTVYVLAEHLAWLEVLRREQRFLDLDSVKTTKELFAAIQRIHHPLATDGLSGPFRVFRGHQRAIGEVMLHRVETSEGTVTDVLGYAAFCDRLETDPGFASWFTRLLAEVDDVAAAGPHGNERLVLLQNELVGLIELLDPEGDWLPLRHRERLPRADVTLPTARTPPN